MTCPPPLVCRLQELPASVSAASGLRALDLSYNPIVNLDASPTPLSGLTQLTRLELMSCNLRRLPAAVASFRRLVHLEVGGNQLSALPTAAYVGAHYCATSQRPNTRIVSENFSPRSHELLCVLVPHLCGYGYCKAVLVCNINTML